jgi:hypothetical protein
MSDFKLFHKAAELEAAVDKIDRDLFRFIDWNPELEEELDEDECVRLYHYFIEAYMTRASEKRSRLAFRLIKLWCVAERACDNLADELDEQAGAD